jgi:hypothetical protein
MAKASDKESTLKRSKENSFQRNPSRQTAGLVTLWESRINAAAAGKTAPALCMQVRVYPRSSAALFRK